MSTTDIKNFGDAFYADKSLIEYEHEAIYATSADLNGSSGMNFDIINENSFTLSSDSHLQIESEIAFCRRHTSSRCCRIVSGNRRNSSSVPDNYLLYQ